MVCNSKNNGLTKSERVGFVAKRRTEEEWMAYKFPLEAKLRDYIRKRINEYNIQNKDINFIKMTKISDRYTEGISDTLFCVCGEFVAIELKVRNNRPTKAQENFLSEVNKSGGIGIVCRTWGEVKLVLNNILVKHGMPLL